MREIKFRAWNKIDKKMFTVDEISWDKNGMFLGEYVFGGCKGTIHLKHCELMQYAGQKDKDGKEIYERDIIKTDYNDVYDFAYYQVVWSENEGAWDTKCLALHHKENGFKDISRGGYCTGYFSTFKNIELIGNIYENPELIGEG